MSDFGPRTSLELCQTSSRTYLNPLSSLRCFHPTFISSLLHSRPGLHPDLMALADSCLPLTFSDIFLDIPLIKSCLGISFLEDLNCHMSHPKHVNEQGGRHERGRDKRIITRPSIAVFLHKQWNHIIYIYICMYMYIYIYVCICIYIYRCIHI